MGYGSFNQSAYGSGNQQALTSGNQAAYLSGNQAAYLSGNQAAVVSGNQAAYASGNQAAYLSGNQAAYQSGNQAATLPMAWGPGAALRAGGSTGAGNPSGHGFLGGYGPVLRSDYATPAALGPVPWVLDFARGNGWAPFPTGQRLNPHDFAPPLQWQVGDWDPGLRFWTLPFDVHLTEWLQDLDLSRPAVMVAREFAQHHAWWLAMEAGQTVLHRVKGQHRLQDLLDAQQHLRWQPGVDPDQAWQFIEGELSELEDLMQDDRGRYLPEADWQSANIATYFFHLMGLDPQAKPATVELLNCATAIANLVKMQYKAHYRRPRPSTLCPGLVPPWGPPGHPAFPSGHSLVAHLVALFLLSVPGLAQRFGIFRAYDNQTPSPVGRVPRLGDFLGAGSVRWSQDMASPLLWLAWRVARTRERLGLHYPSDSRASRRLAVGIWAAVLLPATRPAAGGAQDGGTGGTGGTSADAGVSAGEWQLPRLHLPSLGGVYDRACAEWPKLTCRDPAA